mgnify:CR=1 FL=1
MNQQPEHTGDVTIDRVAVEYGLTQSYGQCHNVRVTVRLEAAISENGSRLLDSEKVLLARPRAKCEEAIDNALEEAGEHPAFYRGPRYDVLTSDKSNDGKEYVAIVPHQGLCKQGWWRRGDGSGWTLRGARRFVAENMPPGLILIDCSDGDLSKLPELVVAEPDPDDDPLF